MSFITLIVKAFDIKVAMLQPAQCALVKRQSFSPCWNLLILPKIRGINVSSYYICLSNRARQYEKYWIHFDVVSGVVRRVLAAIHCSIAGITQLKFMPSIFALYHQILMTFFFVVVLFRYYFVRFFVFSRQTRNTGSVSSHRTRLIYICL